MGEITRPKAPPVITYCPLPHSGRGPAQTCVHLLENFPADLLSPELFLPRARKRVEPTVQVTQALPYLLRHLPWKLMRESGNNYLAQRFCRAIEDAEPGRTIAYFWPDPPLRLLERAKRRGVLTVREMINCYRGTAKAILDQAYEELGLRPSHGITQASIEQEQRELSHYDYIFASCQVQPTLSAAKIDPKIVLPGGFGWSPARFGARREHRKARELKALFVGTVCVRKGAAQLLDAWGKSGVAGELWIAGAVADEMSPIIGKFTANKSIKFRGFTSDLSRLYAEADVFLFPTFEEGDPQVVYEAAGCGLPVITTPMGAGRLIKHDVNGLIVRAGDVDGLASAICRLASSEDLRNALGARAATDAAQFTYDKVGVARAVTLAGLLTSS